jgi:hypothetical protein
MERKRLATPKSLADGADLAVAAISKRERERS